MKTFRADANREARHPNRRRPRSPGVSLRGRGAGLHYWDDETNADGGKRHLHHRARRRAKAELRTAITDALREDTP